MDNILILLSSIKDTDDSFFIKNNLLSIDEINSKNTESIVETLQQQSINISKKIISDFSKQSFHAHQLYQKLFNPNNAEFEESWKQEINYLMLTIVWKRLQPQSPPIEYFDYYIYKGYNEVEENSPIKAIEFWFQAMEMTKIFIDQYQLTDSSFKESFENTYSLNEWINDFLELIIFSLNTDYLVRLQNSLRYVINAFEESQEPYLESFYLNYSQIFYHLNKVDNGDSAFRQILNQRYKWKNGWLQWADNYSKNTFDIQNEEKAIDILEDGLKQVDPLDRIEILLRLKQLYSSQNHGFRLVEINEEIEKQNSQNHVFEDITIDDIEDDKIKEIMKKHNLSNKDIKDLL